MCVCVCVFFLFLPANLKEPTEQSTFDDLKEHIKQKIPENVNFALSEIESFVFKYLSTVDVSKATGLDGTGPKLLIIRNNYYKYYIYSELMYFEWSVSKFMETSKGEPSL